MGTDVHAIIQQKVVTIVDGEDQVTWEDIESKWEERRHYKLFSWLADVRNGYGFAGVETYTPLVPIAEPRGLPEDLIDRERNGDVWVGDHSFTWLTGQEILDAIDDLPVLTNTGVIPLAAYREWDGNMPDSWSGQVDGQNVVTLSSEEAENPKYRFVEGTDYFVRVSWVEHADSLREEFKYFTDEVQRLVDEYGEVRFTLGFDS